MRPHFLNSNKVKNKILCAELLRKIVKNRVGNRPGRIEPRAVKRRRKPFPALNELRMVEKEKLRKKIEKMILKNACA